MAPRYSYIAFEGPIGAETRDLARMVGQAMDAELVEDLNANPFLDDFFKEKNGAAFQCQLFFLLNRYQILEELKQGHLFKPLKISNFIIEKDRIYAYQNLSDSELALYEKLYPLLTAHRVKPDLVVYLQMSPERIMENLKKRKEVRQYHISPEYVENIVEGYNRFFFHYDDTPLIILNANEVNWEKHQSAFEDLLAFFKRDLRGVTYFNPLPDG
ncbi:MAG: deoxynucleoside kinase [Acidobacteriota bacterium]|nr:deoxynucleoside kinase [Acidobacteriota bacterium]